MEEAKKENVFNLPNFLTLCRIGFAAIAVYFIFGGYSVVYIIGAFTGGMITDFLDGQAARRLNMATEFGRKFDMIADRILMLGVVSAIVIKFSLSGILTNFYLLQILILLPREIITVPFALWALLKGRGFPQVRLVGKATTFIQAFAFPLIILNIFFKDFNFSIYFAAATFICGCASAFYYIKDIKNISDVTKRDIA